MKIFPCCRLLLVRLAWNTLTLCHADNRHAPAATEQQKRRHAISSRSQDGGRSVGDAGYVAHCSWCKARRLGRCFKTPLCTSVGRRGGKQKGRQKGTQSAHKKLPRNRLTHKRRHKRMHTRRHKRQTKDTQRGNKKGGIL